MIPVSSAIMMRRRPAARRATVIGALVAAVAMVLSSCSSGEEVVVTVMTTPGVPQNSAPVTVPGQDAANASADPARSSQAPDESKSGKLADVIRVSSKPAFGSKNNGPNDPVTITVFSGKISKMTVTGDDGSTIDGKIADDKATYTTTDKMAYGVTYTFAGEAVAPDNSVKKISGKISTVKPKSTVQALIQIPEGATVGVGAPIVVTFLTPVADRAAAEKALKVTTDKGDVEGSWGWLQDEDFMGRKSPQSQVHFRPKEYWPANTKVTVTADLAGVNLGDGNWGRDDLVRHFTIGRSLVMKAEVSSFHLVVWKDGKIFRNYPVSYGKESEPGRTTVSGIHIVQEKYPEFKMTNPEFGYYNLPERWAIRINNNGEFIHENKGVEKAGYLGKKNVSHGCVNMGGKDAEELYNMVIYGDPVEVTGTTQQMSAKDYVYDWSYSWYDWKTLSALG
jgi:lipoprotein-anchoring transpeptidase ErfK/SrfK